MNIPKLINVNSSNIDGISYLKGQGTLFILFKTKKLYKYNDVEIETYNNFLNSDSKGGYFSKLIREKYTFEMVSDFKEEIKKIVPRLSLFKPEAQSIPSYWF